jgi:hypothetical protein
MLEYNLDLVTGCNNNTLYLIVTDASYYYPNDPPIVYNPTITITPPGFDPVVLPFVINETNVFGSDDLGITEEGCRQNIPDGIYRLEYKIETDELDPPTTISINKTIMRVAELKEKFNNAFLKLDLMECDSALSKQMSVNLNTINFFIEGAIAAANNCAEKEALRLYDKANKMLDNLRKCGCGCFDNNYLLNFR